MRRLPRFARAVLVATALTLALGACVESGPESDPGTLAPVGPAPAPSGPLTLDRVVGIVSDGDASATMSFTPGSELSTSGDDLLSENDYFAGNAGAPAECAAVVSAPYLVSAHDTGARLDDPSALIGTFSELDENRFGLVQVYARQFDDAATASGFFTELADAVHGCAGYKLYDGDTVTVDAVPKGVTTLEGLPSGVTGIRYDETLRNSDSTGVTIEFYQRDGVVISVYGELTGSSTITQAQVDAIAGEVATRLGQL
jgi:hypothetical protein